MSLVKSILGVIRQLKRMKLDANMSKDPTHLMIPEVLQQCEENVTVSCSQRSMTNFDKLPPIPVQWVSVVVRRTIDRRTGVVTAEEVLCNLDPQQRQRPFQGESLKEVLTVFSPGMITQLHHPRIDTGVLFRQASIFLPRSSYRKAIGEGVRTLHMAHTLRKLPVESPENM